MTYNNKGGVIMNYENTKNNYKGFIILIPVFLIILICMIIPLFITIIRSFTITNFIEKAEYIGFTNYQTIFKNDDAFKIIFKNTIIITAFSTIITISVSYVLTLISSYIKKPLRYILVILFLIVSITFIIPYGLERIIEYQFLSGGQETIPISRDPKYIKFFAIIILTLIGIGPTYLLFTIYYLNRDNLQKYFHLTISLQIVITLISFMSVSYLIDSPSIWYKGDILTGYIFDYLYIRYEGGYAGALTVIMGILLIFILVFSNGIVWILNYNINKNQIDIPYNDDHLTSLTQLLLFIILAIISLVLMYPFIQTIFDSFKTLNELFYFPPKLLPEKISLINYKKFFSTSSTTINKYILNSIASIFVSAILIILVSTLSGLGLSQLNPKIRNILLISMTFTFILTPVLYLYFDNNIKYNIFTNSIKMTFMNWTMGMSIYLSTMIFINNRKNIKKLITGIVSLSILVSLSSWFNILYFYTNEAQQILATYMYHVSKIPDLIGIKSALNVILMIIPIVIISISTPLLLNSLDKNNSVIKNS